LVGDLNVTELYRALKSTEIYQRTLIDGE
jgi:hypothetical protein